MLLYKECNRNNHPQADDGLLIMEAGAPRALSRRMRHSRISSGFTAVGAGLFNAMERASLPARHPANLLFQEFHAMSR